MIIQLEINFSADTFADVTKHVERLLGGPGRIDKPVELFGQMFKCVRFSSTGSCERGFGGTLLFSAIKPDFKPEPIDIRQHRSRT